MEWLADSRRFASRSATAVSPAFSVDLPDLGKHTFKLIVHAAAANGGVKAGCNFQAMKGHATIELKCESQVQPSESAVADDTYAVVVNKAEGAQLGMDSRHGWVSRGGLKQLAGA